MKDPQRTNIIMNSTYGACYLKLCIFLSGCSFLMPPVSGTECTQHALLSCYQSLIPYGFISGGKLPVHSSATWNVICSELSALSVCVREFISSCQQYLSDASISDLQGDAIANDWLCNSTLSTFLNIQACLRRDEVVRDISNYCIQVWEDSHMTCLDLQEMLTCTYNNVKFYCDESAGRWEYYYNAKRYQVWMESHSCGYEELETTFVTTAPVNGCGHSIPLCLISVLLISQTLMMRYHDFAS